MNAREYIRKNANIPNLLTLLRLLLVPVYVVLFAKGRKYPALAVFLAACLTDLFDGFLARKLNQITNFGKLVDPFADKVMVLTAMFSMTIGNSKIPQVIPWEATVLLLLKEAVMVVGGLIMLKHGIVVYSSMIGKTAHCVFIGALVATYFHEFLSGALPTWLMSPDLILVWLAVALTLCAMVFYVIDSIRKARALGIIGHAKEKAQP
ncbi:MAG: CDP-alcohol phosphatidyltransferase family protein [Candidatus Limiplasma sp.]|nr:CDP-alcohol phosphatidyltransferase family protein [Candidatus Limiplasma sp.]